MCYSGSISCSPHYIVTVVVALIMTSCRASVRSALFLLGAFLFRVGGETGS